MIKTFGTDSSSPVSSIWGNLERFVSILMRLKASELDGVVYGISIVVVVSSCWIEYGYVGGTCVDAWIYT